jgi:hypothetical protein
MRTNSSHHQTPQIALPPTPTTALGQELYELLTGTSGAAPSAICVQPLLMSLRYVQTEVPTLADGEDRADVVAVVTRELIEQASYSLDKPVSQREHTDADKGAAVRCLLAIEQGTDAMPLHERRKRAAAHLHMEDPRSLTHQHRRKRTGQIETYETRLMDALANKMLEREVDVMRSGNHTNGGTSDATGDSPWLAAAHEAWEAATKLLQALQQCSGFFLPEPDKKVFIRSDYDALELFGKFWKYVKLPGEDDASDPNSGSFAKSLTPILLSESPFNKATVERLSTSIVVAPDITPIPIVNELIASWRAWLLSCRCGDISLPDPMTCPVHRFCKMLELYVEELRTCWDELRDPYRTPSQYRNDPAPDQIAQKYGLRLPRGVTVDK